MTGFDWLLLSALALCTFLAVRSLTRRGKSGGTCSGCSRSCTGCPRHFK